MSAITQTLFLDTSLQTERVLAEPQLLAQVEAQLRLPHVQAITTSYGWMEFQRTVVDDYAHIHGVMNKHAGWGATITHLLDGPRAFRSRAAVRCTKIIGRLYRQSYQDWAFARDLLAEQIERGLKNHFWQNVIPLSDPIFCDLVRTDIILQRDNRYSVPASCRKEHATCHLPKFLRQQQERLRTLADYLASHPQAIKGQDRVQNLLAAVLHDPRAALGQTACWPLGDLIIALQAPAEAVLWTLDPDFAALAAALGLRQANPLIVDSG